MRKLYSTTAWAFLVLACAGGAAAQPDGHYVFDLPAESLSQALRDVALRTGRNVVAPTNLLGAQQAAPLSGTFTAEEAVARLLAGTGLRYRRVQDTLIVERAPFPGKGQSVESAASPITVTGTRIRGTGSTSPVIVTTRVDLERGGINDLADFTRVLPQNYAGGQNRGIAGYGEQGGQSNLNNSATLNLRGLGPDATLTLLGGHRLSYDAVNQGIDISAIPVAAIDRIEVVADGASALYGSDAVGGVANIIFRRDYEGVETDARVGASTGGGNVQQEYGLVGGHRWSTGGFMVALDRSLATPIYANERVYTRSLDPSLTLTDGNRQVSGVVSAHQGIAGSLRMELEGYATNRNSLLQSPFSPNQDVHVNGVIIHSHVRSFALTPTLRADVGHWQASLSATRSDSRSFLDTFYYFDSTPQHAHQRLDDKLTGGEATAEGPLLALPGGDARLAFGGGVRTVSLQDELLILSDDGQSTPVKKFVETRNVQFAYGELSLPLVKPELGLSLLQRLTLSAALRYEHWNRIAAVTTPKIGIVYVPAADVTLRGSWGKSFKIPTLYQVTQLEEGDLIPGEIFTPPPQPAGSPVLLLAGSAPNLRPERATTWSGTVELAPRSVPGLSIRATYFHVDYRDRIAEPLATVGLTALYNPLYQNFIVYNPTAAQVNAIIASLPGGLVNQTGAPFDPSALGAIIDASDRNTERQRIHGLDLSGDYRLELGHQNQLLLTGAASYLESNQQLAPGFPVLPLAGTVFHPPHWRARAGAAWDGKRTDIAVFANYVGQTIDNTFPQPVTVPPFVTIDLNASFKSGAGTGVLGRTELRFSALNLLNQKPHRTRSPYPEAAPYDSTNESPVGRFIGASIRKIW